MRITYRQLVEMMNATFTDEQWDYDVTVEDGINDECFAAELRIADTNHDTLDYNHPVIYINDKIATETIATDSEITTWIYNNLTPSREAKRSWMD